MQVAEVPVEVDNRSIEAFGAVLKALGIKAIVERLEHKEPLYRYFVRLDPKTRYSKLESLAEDIALQMKPIAPPVIRPAFNTGLVLVEMMFDEHPVIPFDRLLTETNFVNTKYDMELPVIFGTTDIDQPLVVDLNKMPHLILAGTTGSGKSMLLHSITGSLLLKSKEIGIKLAMIDPKLVEFNVYNSSPSLLYPVVNDSEEALEMLQDLREEMSNRFKVFQKYNCRDIIEYREKVKKIPYIVLIIDELADLMRVKGFEKLLCELAQKSRAAGIHIVAATQHPSSKVLTGEIRANFPSKIGCKVSTQVHSRVVLDRNGAENLLGKGDALFLDEGGTMKRFKGAFVVHTQSQKVVQQVVKQQSLMDRFTNAVLRRQKRKAK